MGRTKQVGQRKKIRKATTTNKAPDEKGKRKSLGGKKGGNKCQKAQKLKPTQRKKPR